MANTNGHFRLVEGFDPNNEVINEWEWIAEHLHEDEDRHYDELRAAIQLNYAGRGPMFEVPTDEKICEGIDELQQAGVVIET